MTKWRNTHNVVGNTNRFNDYVDMPDKTKLTGGIIALATLFIAVGIAGAVLGYELLPYFGSFS